MPYNFCEDFALGILFGTFQSKIIKKKTNPLYCTFALVNYLKTKMSIIVNLYCMSTKNVNQQTHISKLDTTA